MDESVLSSTLKISGDAMSYSFTEKKRIRKSFAKREKCARDSLLARDAVRVI